MTAKISIVVPAFNAAPLLERCLLSLLDQTVDLHEIVVVDDGSTDATLIVAERYAVREPKVKVISQANAGVSSARNAGLGSVTGDLVGFVDPDDYVDERMYEVLLDALETTGAQLAALRDFTVRPRPHASARELGVQVIPAHAARVELLHLQHPSSVCAQLYRISALERVRFDPGIHFFEDLLFNFEVLTEVDYAALVPGALYHYTPGEAGANARPLNRRGLSALDACRRVAALLGEAKDVTESGSLSRVVERDASDREAFAALSRLETRCLQYVIYKASQLKEAGFALPEIAQFAREVLARDAGLRPAPWLLFQLSARSPGATVSALRSARRLWRFVRSVSRPGGCPSREWR